MNCASVQDRLLLYVAGELEPPEAEELRRHVASCTRCAEAAAELVETQERVERVLRTTVRAPSTLTGRVMGAVRREPRRRLPWAPLVTARGWRRQLMAVSAALALLIGGYFAGHWHGGRNRAPVVTSARSAGTRPLARPTLALGLLGDDHLKYLADPQPAEVPGPDPRDVSRAMTLLLEFPVAAVDLKSEGARLLGGRKCQVQGTPVAFLLYDWEGERVSLYQMDGRKIALPSLRPVMFHGRRFQLGELDGLCYVTWRAGAMNFVMVSGAKPERLLRLACSASGMSQPA